MEPIVEVVTELRFQSGDKGKISLLPGLIFNQFGKSFPNMEALAIPPIELEAFATSPTHRFHGADGIISVSRRTTAFGVVRPYPGWEIFRERAYAVFKFVAQSGTFGEIDRISIKYINLLPATPTEDQLALTNATINVGGRILNNENFSLRAEFPKNGLTGIVQIITRAQTMPTERAPEPLEGIVLDIDVIADGPFASKDIDGAMKMLDAAHTYEKELFFSLLNPSELEKYGPEY